MLLEFVSGIPLQGMPVEDLVNHFLLLSITGNGWPLHCRSSMADFQFSCVCIHILQRIVTDYPTCSGNRKKNRRPKPKANKQNVTTVIQVQLFIMCNQDQFTKIPHSVSITLMICASKEAQWGSSLHSTAALIIITVNFTVIHLEKIIQVTFKRHLIKYSAVGEIQWEHLTREQGM